MLEIKIGKETQEQKNLKVERAVSKFARVKEQIADLTKVLNENKDILVEFGRVELKDNDAASINLISGDDKINIKYDWTVTIKNDKKLRAELGDRYQDLVTIKTTVAPISKLKDMALEEDGDELKSCFEIKEKAPAVKVA